MASVLASVTVLPAVKALLSADVTFTSLVAAAPAAAGGGPGIYDVPVPSAARPYSIVTVSGELPFNTMGGNDDARWGGSVDLTVKAICNDTPAVGLAIVDRAKALIDGQIFSVTGFVSVIAQFEQLHAAYAELVAGQYVWHVPASFSVTVHQS